MVVRKTLQEGELQLIAENFDILDVDSQKTQGYVQDVVDTMRNEGLIGLAAPQLGINKNIFVTELRKTKNRKESESSTLQVFINPEIISFSDDEVEMFEGCGSVNHADLFAPVMRPNRVTIKALGLDGKTFEFEADGLLSRVIQHEYDHLEGILFTAKICDESRIMTGEEYRAMKEKLG